MRQKRLNVQGYVRSGSGGHRRQTIARLAVTLGLVLGICFPTLTQDAAAEADRSFESDQFGYVLAWEAPWTYLQETVEDGYDGVMLIAGAKMASFITISADAGAVSFDSSQEVMSFFVSNLQSSLLDAEVSDDDPDAEIPWTEFTYSSSRGPSRALLEVFVLNDGDAFLGSIIEGPEDDFDEALAQAADGIRLDGNVFIAQDRAGQNGARGNDGADSNEHEQASNGNASEHLGEHEESAVSGVARAVTAVFGGGPAHSGEQPGPAPSESPEPVWTFETGDDFVGASAVAVSLEEGIAYTSSNAVYAIDTVTGEERWSYQTDMGFVAPLALADGVLYAAGEDGNVYAFEPDSGDIIWRSVLTGGLPVDGGPLVVDDTIYVTAWDGNAYALETKTGEVRWSASLGGITYGQPAYADGFIVLASPSGGMMALDAESGDAAWTTEMEEPAFPAPSIAEGVVYFGGGNGTLYAVDLATGDEIWTLDTGAPVSAALAIADGVVYVTNEDAVLGAYDAASGDEQWTVDVVGSDLGGVSVTQSDAGETLILVGDGQGSLHAFDDTGEEVYAVDVTNAALFLPVTVVDNVIYVAARDGSVSTLSVPT